MEGGRGRRGEGEEGGGGGGGRGRRGEGEEGGGGGGFALERDLMCAYVEFSFGFKLH